jgi:environmental stress-induced protein Ves
VIRPVTLIPFAGLTVSRWRNGAGRKADIAAGPDWLVGFAWLDGDAPFSDYAGHDRTITLIEGRGFTLDFGPSRPALIARRPFLPLGFNGGWEARCRLLGGACLVLNAVTARDRWVHRVMVSPVGPVAAPPPGAAALLVVLEGRVSIDGETAGPRDAFRIAGATTPTAGAGARVALVRIDPAPPHP